MSESKLGRVETGGTSESSLREYSLVHSTIYFEYPNHPVEIEIGGSPFMIVDSSTFSGWGNRVKKETRYVLYQVESVKDHQCHYVELHDNSAFYIPSYPGTEYEERYGFSFQDNTVGVSAYSSVGIMIDRESRRRQLKVTDAGCSRFPTKVLLPPGITCELYKDSKYARIVEEDRKQADQISTRGQETTERIFELAGKRNYEQIRDLIDKVKIIIEEENRRGGGKLGRTIKETIGGRYGNEHFVDGRVAYLPAKGRVVFIGDTHGDSLATESIIRQTKFIENMENGPKDVTLVFLGDYVDRGANDIRNIEIVLALKKRYSQNVILMRGNHDSSEIFSKHGFLTSLIKRFDDNIAEKLSTQYNELFSKLPVITVCANGIVAIHGGVPNVEPQNLQELRNNETAFEQILWNDPNEEINNFQINDRSILGSRVYAFGPDAFRLFMDKIGAKVMVRSHQVSNIGCLFNNRLVTIFSTGGNSCESDYQKQVPKPKFMMVSLEAPVTKVDTNKHVFPVKY